MSVENKTNPEQCKKTKHTRDTLSGIVTGTIFVLAGFFILAENQGFLYDSWVWWLMFSSGIVLFIETIIRIRSDRYNRPVTATVIWGTILTTIGATQLYNMEDWWPIILVAAGIVLIIHSLKQPAKQTV